MYNMVEKTRFGSLVVLARKNSGKKLEFLILQHSKEKTWELVKGGLEEGENFEDAARREVKEETGLDINKLIKLESELSFEYKKEFHETLGHRAVFKSFISIVPLESKISLIDPVFSKYEWVDFKSATEKLEWDNIKRILKEAYVKLSSFDNEIFNNQKI